MKNQDVSLILFSINEYELIRDKIKTFYPYFDEIIIIDSSTDDRQKKLTKELEKRYNKIKVFWLPPFGMAEFYYKIAFRVCNSKWIFWLDSDEIPTKKLLREIKKVIRDKYEAFKIWRFKDTPKFKLVKRDKIFPTGIIHWSIGVLTRKYKELDRKLYKIYQKRKESKISIKNKIKKYVKIEAFQIPLKILFGEYLFSKNFSFPIERIETKFLWKLGRLNTLFLFFSSLIYILFSIFPFFTRKSYYYLLCLIEFLKSPFKNILIALLMKRMGVYKFLYLDSLSSFRKISREIDFGKSSIENLSRLIDYSLRKNYRYILQET